MNRAEQWGLRCFHEAKLWPSNYFVTLTYNDDCLPKGNTLVVRDVQLFMKRLRLWASPTKIRFFCGGEYGETNLRPHYHLLLFNTEFPELKQHGKNARGDLLYTCAALSELWPLGFHLLGRLTLASAIYAAKYSMKKVTGEAATDHYTWIDSDGVVYERLPEFAIMSRKPGLGHGYYAKYGKEIRDHDYCVVDGRKLAPPRYYDDLGKRADEPRVLAVKAQRKRMSVREVVKADNTPERLRVKEKLAILAAERKERKL